MHQTVYNKPRLKLVPANSPEGRRIAREQATHQRRAGDARMADRQTRRAITRRNDRPEGEVTR